MGRKARRPTGEGKVLGVTGHSNEKRKGETRQHERGRQICVTQRRGYRFAWFAVASELH